MDELIWLIGLYILYNLFFKRRDTKPSEGESPTFPPELDRPRRFGSRNFPQPAAGMPASSRSDSPVQPEMVEESPTPSQFPWSFPELFEEVASTTLGEPSKAEATPVSWSPVESASGLNGPDSFSPGLSRVKPIVTKPEAGLSLSSRKDAVFRFTPAGVAGGIIWSEILQTPRSQRPYQWRRKLAKPAGRK
jgi:hypothetical protein